MFSILKNVLLQQVKENNQKQALKVFKKTYDISKLKWYNKDDEEFEDDDKMKNLLDWLEAKNFNRERIKKQIDKALA